MMRRLSKAWLAIAVVLAAGACGSDNNSTSPIVGASGTWSLQAINGSALPVTLGSGSQALAVLGSTLTISANGNYNEVVTVRVAGDATNTTLTEFGTWTFANGVVTFNDQSDGIIYTGTVTDNTLTENSGNFVSVYSRQ
jgi:hypothetical protein